MEIREFGATGLKSSRVVLGTLTFGSQVDEADARRMVGRARDAGINHFDTANSYNRGVAEQILGRAVRRFRSEVVIATKVFDRYDSGPDGAGLRPSAIRRAIDQSLNRLGTDYVDLYYLHAPDRSVPLEDTLGTLADLVRQGKVRHTGFSNYSAWQVADMLAITRGNGWPEPRIGQQLYNVISRSLDEEYAEFASTHGIATIVYNPLAGGLLTGKYRGLVEPPPGRFAKSKAYRDRYWSPAVMVAVEQLAQYADRLQCDLTALAYRWLVSQPVVDGIILGAADLEQFEHNLAAISWSDPPAEMLAVADEVWQTLRGPFPRYCR